MHGLEVEAGDVVQGSGASIAAREARSGMFTEFCAEFREVLAGRPYRVSMGWDRFTSMYLRDVLVCKTVGLQSRQFRTASAVVLIHC